VTLTVSVDEIVANSRNGRLGVGRGWGRVRLREVAKIQNGFAFKSTRFNKEGRGLPLLRIRDVEDDLTEAFYDGDFEDRYLVAPGDIVVGMDGDFRVARWRGPIALLNQRVAKITTRADAPYDERFLLYALPGYLDAIHAQTSSVTVKHLSSRTLDDIPLPHPPLAEQQQIVAAIEEQFSRLDAAGESTRSARRRLRLLASSVREEVARGSWQTRPLADVVNLVTGNTPSTKVHEYWGPGLPFITPSDFKHGARVVSGGREVTTKGVSKARPLPGNTVLLTCIGATIGKTGLAEVECVTNQQITALIPDSRWISARYLFHAVCTPTFQRSVFSNSSSTTMPILNKTRLAGLPLPLPPLGEQERLVEKVEASLSVLEGVGAGLIDAKRKASALRATVLREAFAGRLVPPARRGTAREEVTT
jgi:type I restriction enzyme S subunit